jgi:hypothetical protein
MMEPEEGVLIEEPGIGAFQLRVRSGATAIFADEPVSAGGPSSAPDPFALAAASGLPAWS